MFICDEADLLLEKHAVFLEKLPGLVTWKYGGLAAVYKSPRAYFMSATFDKYQRRLLNDAFCVPEDEIITF